MRTSQFLLLGIVWLTVGACEKAAPASRPAVPGESESTKDPTVPAGLSIDTTSTLGDWLAANPGDSVSASFAVGQPNEWLCRVAVGRSSFAGQKLVRTAVFNVQPPADTKLPDDTTRTGEKVCRLRTLLFETDRMDSVRASRVVDSLTAAISAKLGAAKAWDSDIDGPPIAWFNGKTWKFPAITIILAIQPDKLPPPRKSAPRPNEPPRIVPYSAAKVMLAVFSHRSGIRGNDYWETQYFEGQHKSVETLNLELADADSAIAWARLPKVAADLGVMVTELHRLGNESGTSRNPEADSALIRAIRAIHDTAPHLDPPRRAAALVAGDLVRYAAVPYAQIYGDDPNAPLYHTAQSIILGSDSDRGQMGYWWNRVWLWDAYEADSLGPAGHLAFVRLLKRFFNQRAECADGVDDYKTVIEHGEAALQRGENDPLIHYYLATAYKSIFDYSTFVPEDTSIHNPSKAEGESARLRAIAHFQAALPGLRDTQMRRDGWVMAADLMLGKPGHPFMECMGEDD